MSKTIITYKRYTNSSRGYIETIEIDGLYNEKELIVSCQQNGVTYLKHKYINGVK